MEKIQVKLPVFFTKLSGRLIVLLMACTCPWFSVQASPHVWKKKKNKRFTAATCRSKFHSTSISDHPPDVKPFPSCKMKNGCFLYTLRLLFYWIVTFLPEPWFTPNWNTCQCLFSTPLPIAPLPHWKVFFDWIVIIHAITCEVSMQDQEGSQ